MPTVAVIGAGITGVTTAYELQNRGLDVVVFDRHRYAAMETSYANGGQVSASDGELWNTWGNVRQGLAWMLKPDAPLAISPWPEWRKLTWLAGFVGAIPQWRENTLAIVRMAIEARGILLDIAEREGIAFARTDRGVLHLHATEAGVAAAHHVHDVFREAGLEVQPIGPAGIRDIEPAIVPAYAGGSYSADDFTGDVHAFSRGLADVCIRRGADFRFATDVRGVETVAGGVCITDTAGKETRADAVVICAGVATRDMARRLGDHIPIYPVKGYSLTVHLDDEASRAAAPRCGVVDEEARIVAARIAEDRLRIAGTAELAGANLDIRETRIRPLVNWCRRVFPDVSTERMTPWAGLRPMIPSMQPRVGPGSRPRVFYNSGHGYLGWTLGTATAVTIADTVAETLGAHQSTVRS